MNLHIPLADVEFILRKHMGRHTNGSVDVVNVLGGVLDDVYELKGRMLPQDQQGGFEDIRQALLAVEVTGRTMDQVAGKLRSAEKKLRT